MPKKKNDGKKLEHIVSLVEKLHLPEGFTVKVNEKAFNDKGTQVAEFDIEIRGKIGTTKFAWLVECRDRPSGGAAPGSWIEQLYGRRDLRGFDRIIAVSTTGFSSGAVELARRGKIELRELQSIDQKALSWLMMQIMPFHARKHILHSVAIGISSKADQRAAAHLPKILEKMKSGATLFDTENGTKVSASQIFSLVLAQHPQIWENVVPNGDPYNASVNAEMKGDRLFLETPDGRLDVVQMKFGAYLSIVEKPMTGEAFKYHQLEDGDKREPISEIVKFDVVHDNKNFSLQMHKLSDTGETRLVLQASEVAKPKRCSAKAKRKEKKRTSKKKSKSKKKVRPK